MLSFFFLRVLPVLKVQIQDSNASQDTDSASTEMCFLARTVVQKIGRGPVGSFSRYQETTVAFQRDMRYELERICRVGSVSAVSAPLKMLEILLGDIPFWVPQEDF